MATRTTPEYVEAAITVDSSLDLSGSIRTANVLTSAISSQDSDGLLSDNMLIEIETYLACHFYALRDPQYQSKNTGDASAVFQGQTGMKFESTWWGQMALALDATGYLDKLGSKKIQGSVKWLGKEPSEQTAYEDRD